MESVYAVLGLFALAILFVPLVMMIVLFNRVRGLRSRIEQLERSGFAMPPRPMAPIQYAPAPAAFVPPPPAPAPRPVPAQPAFVPPPPAPQTVAPPINAAYRAPYIPPPPAAPAPAAPKPPRPSLEARLGQNWLNKLGITALVIGLSLGLGKLIVNMGPLGKDAIGFVLALGILALGIFLERKPTYKLFARVLIGGGWALTFFLSYAIYHVDALQIVHSELLDLVLMLIVSAAMVVHSLRYHSQTVTTVAYLLAFVTVGLSHVTLFSLVTGALLAGSLAFIVYRERWYALGLAGLIGVYFNHFLWLSRVLPDGGVAYLRAHGHAFPQFVPSAALLLAYWLIFRLVYVFRPPLTTDRNHQRDQMLSTLTALLNSAGLLSLMKHQSSHPEWAFYGLLVLGFAELALSLIARGGLHSDTSEKPQPNRVAFIVLSTMASLLLLAAIPLKFHGTQWPLLWLLEAEAFYMAGLRLPESVFRRIGIVASVGTGALFSLIGFSIGFYESIFGVGTLPAHGPVHRIPIVLAISAVLYFNAEFTPQRWPVAVASAFDRVALLTGSWLASLLIALLCWYKLQPISVAVAWGVLGLVLFEVSSLLRKPHLRLQAWALLAAAFIRIFFANMNVHPATGGMSPSLYTVLPLIAAFAWVYERVHAETEAAKLDRFFGAAFAWCGVIAAGTLLYFEVRPGWVILAWTLLAIALLALTAVLKRTIFIAQSYVVLAAVAVRGIGWHLFSPTPLAATFASSRVFTIALTSGLLLASLPIAFYLRKFFSQCHPERSEGPASPTRHLSLSTALHHPEQPFFFIPLTLITLLLYVELSGGRITIGWVALGFATFLFALAVQSITSLSARSYRLAGLGLLMLGVAKIIFWDFWHASSNDKWLTLIVMGASMLLISFLYSRYKETLLKFL